MPKTLAAGSKADEALREIEETLATMAPRHEGFRDYARLNLEPETLDAVHGAIATYDRRTALLEQAHHALTALIVDGHPTLDMQEVSQAVLRDLQANEDTIKAALSQFASNEATNLGLKGTTPEVK